MMFKHLSNAARGRVVVSLMLAPACLLLSPPAAHAQQGEAVTIRATRGMFFGGPGGAGPAISKGDFERYMKMVGVGEDQRLAGEALFEAYHSEVTTARKSVDDKRRALMAEFQDTQDHRIFAEEMPAVMEAHKKRMEAAEASLLNDFRDVLDAKQAEQWPRVERARRRDTLLAQGSLAGESMDLTKVIDGLKLTEKAANEVGPLIEAYETQLDTALRERSKVQQEQSELLGSMEGGLDMEKFQEAQKRTHEAAVRVRDVNDRFARQAEDLVSDDVRGEFRKRVRQQTYPQVYKESYVTRVLDALDTFEDLSASQRSSIASIRQAYAIEVERANDRWAAEIAKSQTGDGMPLSIGGAQMIVSFGAAEGDDKPFELDNARKARRDLDRNTLEQINAMLSPEQQERLPKREDQNEHGEDVRMIRTGR